MQFICEQANNCRNTDDIEAQLQARFNKLINVNDVTAITTAGEQQLKIFNVLDKIADQKKNSKSSGERLIVLKNILKITNLVEIF